MKIGKWNVTKFCGTRWYKWHHWRHYWGIGKLHWYPESTTRHIGIICIWRDE